MWSAPLHLRAGVREHFLTALARDWPEEVERYEELYARSAYLPSAITGPVREHVRAAARTAPVPMGSRPVEPRLPARSAQLTLAV